MKVASHSPSPPTPCVAKEPSCPSRADSSSDIRPSRRRRWRSPWSPAEASWEPTTRSAWASSGWASAAWGPICRASKARKASASRPSATPIASDSTKRRRDPRQIQARRREIRRSPQADREQGPRRRRRGHDAVLARPADHLGVPGRQGRLLREAAFPLHLGRPADGQGCSKAQPPRPNRHPEPLQRDRPRVDGLRQERRSSARSSTSRRLPTSRGRRSASGPSRCRSPRRSTTNSGAARPRKEPIYRDRIQYDCSFTWNMGDGESCNQGVHEIDLARWVLGEEKLPRRVISCGGRFTFNDAGDVPNTQIIYYDFPSAPVLYEVHNMVAGQGLEGAPDFLGVADRHLRPLRGRPRDAPHAASPATTRARRSRRSPAAKTISATSSAPSAPAIANCSTPTSSKAIARPP